MPAPSPHRITVPINTLCPWRSPCSLPKDIADAPSKIVDPHDPSKPAMAPEYAVPNQVLGPCLGPGCVMFLITASDEKTGQPTEGVCAFRANAMAADNLAASVAQLVKLLTVKMAGESAAFGLSPPPARMG